MLGEKVSQGNKKNGKWYAFLKHGEHQPFQISRRININDSNKSNPEVEVECVDYEVAAKSRRKASTGKLLVLISNLPNKIRTMTSRFLCERTLRYIPVPS